MAAAVLLAGCAHVVKATPEEVQVDTETLGELVPGVRGWRAWLNANEHCAAYGKKPKLVDLKGSIAVFSCVVEE